MLRKSIIVEKCTMLDMCKNCCGKLSLLWKSKRIAIASSTPHRTVKIVLKNIFVVKMLYLATTKSWGKVYYYYCNVNVICRVCCLISSVVKHTYIRRNFTVPSLSVRFIENLINWSLLIGSIFTNNKVLEVYSPNQESKPNLKSNLTIV